MEENLRATGWLPDYPDFRDYTVEQAELPTKLKKLATQDPVRSQLAKTDAFAAPAILPSVIDLRQWMPPIEDQGALGSCTANETGSSRTPARAASPPGAHC